MEFVRADLTRNLRGIVLLIALKHARQRIVASVAAIAVALAMLAAVAQDLGGGEASSEYRKERD